MARINATAIEMGTSELRPSARLDVPTRGDEEDLLGRVGRRRDRVRREDGERDQLRDALVLLLRAGERPAHEDALDEGHRPGLRGC